MMMQLRLPRVLRRFARDRKGVSAVEFALLLPLMMTFYIGGAEVSQAVSASRKATLVARTLADLSSQSSGITAANMTNILDASAAVVAPFNSSNLQVTVSQVKIDANNNATIDWSVTRNGTARTIGATVTLPAGLVVANSYLIWSEVDYNYQPAIGYVITGNLHLTDKMYMRPRLSTSVTYPATS
jgi:Flp pilus assembly protein TadG